MESIRRRWLLVSLWLAVEMLAARSSGQEQAPAAAVEYMILVTGGELLSGAFPDAHTFFLTRTLYPLGLRCVGSLTVDDIADDIHTALRFATDRVRLVIVTGGLGPTENDITRETLAAFTGVPLAEDLDVLQAMERRTGVPRDQLRANLRRQARVPTRGTYLANVGGSSVGLVFEWEDRVIVALPGPPGELQSMVRQRLVPWLAERFGTRLPGSLLTVRFVGLGQSQIDQTLQEHAPLAPDIILQSLFEAGRVDFTFVLPDNTPENGTRLEELKEKILAQLGDHVYGVGDVTLEQVVLRQLAARRETLAVAEAGSGGALAAALSAAEHVAEALRDSSLSAAEHVAEALRDSGLSAAEHVAEALRDSGFSAAEGVAPAGRALAGAVVAAEDQRLGRLLEADRDRLQATVSAADRAGQLAAAAAEHLQADWGLAIGQVQTAPDGTRHVEVALHAPDGRIDRHRITIRGTDPSGRAHLTTRLLELLWRRLR